VKEVLPVAAWPRLCHIIKWGDGQGFGFHLLADKKKEGHFIGKLDPQSPADSAGLLLGDRVIEVNGVNINSENHKQVVERIKAVPDETKLLVIDAQTALEYREGDWTLSGSQGNVRYLTSSPPEAPPLTPPLHSHADDVTSQQTTLVIERASTPETPPKTPPTPPTSQRPLSSSTLSAAVASGLDMNMSAAQLRARLASRKKYDPRHDAIDLRRKHQIIQTM